VTLICGIYGKESYLENKEFWKEDHVSEIIFTKDATYALQLNKEDGW